LLRRCTRRYTAVAAPHANSAVFYHTPEERTPGILGMKLFSISIDTVWLACFGNPN